LGGEAELDELDEEDEESCLSSWAGRTDASAIRAKTEARAVKREIVRDNIIMKFSAFPPPV
jgi:hypothetical protein